MIEHSGLSFGPDSRDRRAEIVDPGRLGAIAALETFYFALNNKDVEALTEVLSQHPLAQLNNPLGGILRGGESIVDLYASKIFRGGVTVQVTFRDFVRYAGERHSVFAGRETGTYAVDGGEPQPLAIRTSRYFRYDPDRESWLQFHHHGSIDDPEALAAYQHAVLG